MAILKCELCEKRTVSEHNEKYVCDNCVIENIIGKDNLNIIKIKNKYKALQKYVNEEK